MQQVLHCLRVLHCRLLHVGRPSPGHHHWLLAMVVGIFMHVATTILFESEEGHRVNLQKGSAIALGTVLAIGTIALPIH